MEFKHYVTIVLVYSQASNKINNQGPQWQPAFLFELRITQFPAQKLQHFLFILIMVIAFFIYIDNGNNNK